MRRLSAVVFFFVLTHYVITASTIAKDVEEVGAIEMIDVPVPDADTAAVAKPNSVTSDVKCAQLGEPCIYHNDCCSRACLGYAKRCVT